MSLPSTVALKVDVCTHDGMRDGVPRLLALLAEHRVKASFFLSFGPDNAGKAVKHLFRPGFLKKMVRSSAPSMYGLRPMLSGTLLPARPIAAGHPDFVRDASDEVRMSGGDRTRGQERAGEHRAQAVHRWRRASHHLLEEAGTEEVLHRLAGVVGTEREEEGGLHAVLGEEREKARHAVAHAVVRAHVHLQGHGAR